MQGRGLTILAAGLLARAPWRRRSFSERPLFDPRRGQAGAGRA